MQLKTELLEWEEVCRAESENTTKLLEQFPLDRLEQRGEVWLVYAAICWEKNKQQNISHKLSEQWCIGDDLSLFCSHGTWTCCHPGANRQLCVPNYSRVRCRSICLTAKAETGSCNRTAIPISKSTTEWILKKVIVRFIFPLCLLASYGCSDKLTFLCKMHKSNNSESGEKIIFPPYLVELLLFFCSS